MAVSQSLRVSAATAAKSLQSCPTLCDPMDCSLPGSSAHGIFQARVLEWVAIAFSDLWMKPPLKYMGVWLLDQLEVSCVELFLKISLSSEKKLRVCMILMPLRNLLGP